MFDRGLHVFFGPGASQWRFQKLDSLFPQDERGIVLSTEGVAAVPLENEENKCHAFGRIPIFKSHDVESLLAGIGRRIEVRTEAKQLWFVTHQLFCVRPLDHAVGRLTKQG